MGITAADIASNAAIAGPRFEWNSPGMRFARPNSGVRNGLRVFLFDSQDGHCAFCDREFDMDSMELCHIVPGMEGRYGFRESNIALGCRPCNEVDGNRIVPIETIRGAWRIPTEWPKVRILMELGREWQQRRTIELSTKRQRELTEVRRIRGM